MPKTTAPACAAATAITLALAALITACIPPNAQHTLTIIASPAGAGTVTVDPVKPIYVAGSIVTLEAKPAPGWAFARWDTPGVNTTQATVELIMFRNVTATAFFLPANTATQPGIQDSGFEQGPQGPAWAQTSTNFPTLICNLATCETIEDVGPHAGQHWAAFGNAPQGEPETATLAQMISIPANAPVFLQFFLAIPRAEANFIFQASLAGEVLFEATEADQETFADYMLVSIDISQSAGASPVPLTFSYQNANTGTNRINVFLDDVILIAQGAN